MDALIRNIESAFSSSVYPGDSNISRNTYDEGTADYFRGKTWRGHTAKQLRALDFSLTVFTASAFAYYLPAYMIADIISPTEADTISESLLFHMSPSIAASPLRAREIISLLSPEQKHVARAYFEYVQARDGACPDDEFDDVLATLK